MPTFKEKTEQLENLITKYRSNIPNYVIKDINEHAKDGRNPCKIRLAKGTSSVTLVDNLQAFLAACDARDMIECKKSNKKLPYIPSDNFKSRKMFVEIHGPGLIRSFSENFQKYASLIKI